jgi:hypothetical protein
MRDLARNRLCGGSAFAALSMKTVAPQWTGVRGCIR